MIALSSAYKQALVAVEINGKRACRTLDANCKHSENLLPALDDAMQEINEGIQYNDTFCVVIGPGSFTGLRIATALVKGILAGSKEKNVLPITTFELMAYSYIKNFQPKENFACIINGLSGYYFICEFDTKGNIIKEPQMIKKEQFDKVCLAKVGLCEENICQNVVNPTAEQLLELAKEKIKTFSLVNVEEITPLYLRKSQAEDAIEEKEKK